MSQYCKHGIDMRITCRKCGRIMQVDVPFFAAKRYAFTNSIQRLEETVRKMQVDLASRRPEIPPHRTTPDPEPQPTQASEQPAASEAPPPPPAPPPQRYPWQRG
ncbi:MAG TPA: hypothetical protein VHL54_03305 [Actinomycetota bacterium]|nr:hypothetical protein [Actinomycetota bacterium]